MVPNPKPIQEEEEQMAAKAKKSRQMKSDKAMKAPKPEKVLGYFRPGTAVAVIADYVSDERPHKIADVLEHAQKTGKIKAKQADFAFRVLFTNPYTENGGSIGKIAARRLGGAVANFQEGTVLYSRNKRVTEVVKAKEEKFEPKAKD